MNTKFDELLEFPCKFPFKVLGVADPALPDMVVEVLQQHAPGTYSPTVQPSSKGNYHSVRVTVTSIRATWLSINMMRAFFGEPLK